MCVPELTVHRMVSPALIVTLARPNMKSTMLTPTVFASAKVVVVTGTVVDVVGGTVVTGTVVDGVTGTVVVAVTGEVVTGEVVTGEVVTGEAVVVGASVSSGAIGPADVDALSGAPLHAVATSIDTETNTTPNVAAFIVG